MHMSLPETTYFDANLPGASQTVRIASLHDAKIFVCRWVIRDKPPADYPSFGGKSDMTEADIAGLGRAHVPNLQLQNGVAPQTFKMRYCIRGQPTRQHDPRAITMDRQGSRD
jgi:hypothetical protein